MRTRIAAGVVVLLTAASSLSDGSQDDLLVDLFRFELFNECRPISLVVPPVRDAATAIGLTENRIRNAVEVRLRSASIYRDVRPWVDAIAPFDPMNPRSVPAHSIMVVVSVVGPAFDLDVRYRKEFWDSVSETSGYAITWTNGMTGTHGGDAGYVLRGLSEVVDLFVLDYLRVNESAC